MSQRTLEFYYDLASAYSYLASTQLESLAQRHEVTLVWKPFLLGGVFKATGNQMPALVPARIPYLLKDLERWTRLYKIPLKMPSRFPINSLVPMRALAAVDAARLPALTHQLMQAYWVRDLDISAPEVLADLIGADLLARTQEDAAKAALKANTEEAVRKGAFGAPTLFIDANMFFGNDRIPLLELYLRGALD